MSDRHTEAFREEAAELLAELESSLLELAERADDSEAVGRVFRALHTIKGSGAMFGFNDVADTAHEVEAVFDRVRERELPVTPALIDLALAALDRIRGMLDGRGDVPREGPDTASIVASLRRLAGGDAGIPGAAPAPRDEGRAGGGSEVVYRIRFRPDSGIFRNGTNPVLLLKELARLGGCRIIAHTDGIPLLDDIDPERCYLSWDVILTTALGEDAIRDVFLFVGDDCRLDIKAVGGGWDADAPEGLRKLGEILVERGDLSPEDLGEVLRSQRRVGEILVDQGIVSGTKVHAALVEQERVRQAQKALLTLDSAKSIRVASEKLDVLVNLVGELVTAQARLSQTSAERGDAVLTSIAEEVERLTWALRDQAMSVRMTPIGASFSKFRRLVRDLAAELGKEVELVAEGGETELDKTVIEKLSDPLVHLIRNCIDHGIEPPDARERAGKPGRGTVRLAASQSGGHVVIRVVDDGAGLDREAIRAQALAAGLASPEDELADRDLFGLILLPGFTTVRAATSVSGRGVGMDVVKQAVEGLRGTIVIESRPGEGTEIAITIPLTLAIIEGLLVRVGEGSFVLPLSAVEECVELLGDEARRSNGRRLIDLRGRPVPYIRLRETFGVPGTAPPIEQIVVAGADGERLGIVVDQVIGGHQTVIKSLGRVYRDVPGISGSTILGDGTVALILDVPKLAART